MMEDAPFLIVDSDEGVRALATRLARASVIAVDTESDSMYHYQEKVCLLQFTDSEGDVILDPLGCTTLDPLKPIFADPTIVKVFHGADYDIVCLKRDYGFRIRNLFDTLVAAQFVGLTKLGLADLIGNYFGVPIDKLYQRHDWSQRPLLPEHLDYARGDTHYLLALREIMLRALARVGRVGHQIEECEALERKEWPVKAFEPNGYLRVRGAKDLDETGQAIMRALYVYRDGQARRMDRPSYKVLGDDVMLEVAARRPTTVAAVERLFPSKRPLLRRHGDGLAQAVRTGLADETPLPTGQESEEPEVEQGTVRIRGRAADRVVEALKDWRNHLVHTSRMHTPYSVASNSDLKAIARARPFTIDELAEVPGLRSWQVHDHGHAILGVLDQVAPESGMVDEGPSRKRRRR